MDRDWKANYSGGFASPLACLSTVNHRRSSGPTFATFPKLWTTINCPPPGESLGSPLTGLSNLPLK